MSLFSLFIREKEYSIPNLEHFILNLWYGHGYGNCNGYENSEIGTVFRFSIIKHLFALKSYTTTAAHRIYE